MYGAVGIASTLENDLLAGQHIVLPGLDDGIRWNGNGILAIGNNIATYIHRPRAKIHQLNKFACGITARPGHDLIDHDPALCPGYGSQEDKAGEKPPIETDFVCVFQGKGMISDKYIAGSVQAQGFRVPCFAAK